MISQNEGDRTSGNVEKVFQSGFETSGIGDIPPEKDVSGSLFFKCRLQTHESTGVFTLEMIEMQIRNPDKLY